MRVPQLRTAAYLAAAGYLLPLAVEGCWFVVLRDIDEPGPMALVVGGVRATSAAAWGIGALLLATGLASAVVRSRDAATARPARALALATVPGLCAAVVLVSLLVP